MVAIFVSGVKHPQMSYNFFMSLKNTAALLGVLIVAAIILRLPFLEARSIWFDEAFSWRLISFSFPEMISRTGADVHPPLYYLLLKSWATFFGSHITSLRVFSVILSAATLIAVYGFIGNAFRSRLLAFLSASLLAVSGWQIFFSQEARMYTLGSFLAVLSVCLLWRSLQSSQYSWWLAWSLAVTAFMYTHYYAVFSVAAQVIVVVWVVYRRRQWSLLKNLGLSLGLAFILYLPWLPVLYQQSGRVQGSFWVPQLDRWSIPDTLYRFYLPTTQSLWHQGLGVILTLVPLALTSLVGLVLIARSLRGISSSNIATLLIVSSAILPFLGSVAVSLFGQSLYQDRFLFFAHTFLLLMIMVWWWHFKTSWLRIAGAALTCLVFFSGTIAYWQELKISQRGGVRAATEFIITQKEPAPVIVSSSFIYFSVLHYFEENNLSHSSPQLLSHDIELIHFAGGPILKTTDIITPQQLANLPSQNLWVIDTTGFGGRPTELSADWLKQEQHIFPEVFPFQGEIMITRYQRVL